MNPSIAPPFEQLRDRLYVAPWFSNVGRSTAVLLPFPCRFVSSRSEAKAAIEQPEWEDWTLERRNDLTSYLHDRFPNRDADWNRIAQRVREVVEGDIVPVASPVLAATLPGSTVALDALRWDLAGALMEAAYDDCQPPQFFTHLVAVYESGHLPVGWEGSNEGGALLIY